MARQKLNDIITYLETKLATSSDLVGNIRYTEFEEQPPPVLTYGAHIYLTADDPNEDERRHIGPLLTETWSIHLDIIVNRSFQKSRQAISDTKGISYWIDFMKALLQNGTNSGAFEDSFWQFNQIDSSQDGYTLKGVFVCEVLNNYS